MCYKNKNHASAYILVVSVVATLALIGSIFLMSSLDERRASEARVETAPAASAVDTVIDEIGKMLVEDLCIVYPGGLYAADTNWRAYVDYASPNPADSYDPHLASVERAQTDGRYVRAGNWPKISNMCGYPTGLVTNVNPAWRYVPTSADGSSWPEYDGHISEYNPAFAPQPGLSITNIPAPAAGSAYEYMDNRYRDNNIVNGFTYDCIPLIDADGDGVRDSLLYPTESYSGSNRRYYAAVRIIDLSAFVNVNTAFYANADGSSPAWMMNGPSVGPTVGMITPGNLPMFWPDTSSSHAPSDWAFTDYDGDFAYDVSDFEEYAPSYVWPDRNVLVNNKPSVGLSNADAGFDIITMDNGFASSPSPAFPDTHGRGVDQLTADQTYADYYYAYVTRMGNPDTDIDGEFIPFDISDEIACRWLDTAHWYDDNDTVYNGRNIRDSYYAGDNLPYAGSDLLKSSRLSRLLGFNDRANVDPWRAWAYYGRYLTTMSRSREIARYRPLVISDGYGDSIFDDLDSSGSGNNEEMAQWFSTGLKIDVNMDIQGNKVAAFNDFRRAFAWALGLDQSMDAQERCYIYQRAATLALELIDYRDRDNKVTYADLATTGFDVDDMSNPNPALSDQEGCLDIHEDYYPNNTSSGVPLAQRIYGSNRRVFVSPGYETYYEVRGMERHPVISHVWAKVWFEAHKPLPGNIYDQKRERLIVAIYNPYDQEIDLDDYYFEDGDGMTVNLSGTLDGKDWVIVATHDTADLKIDPSYTIFTEEFLNYEGTYTLKVPSEDLEGNAGPDVVVSSFSWDNVGGPIISHMATSGALPYTGMGIYVRDLDVGEHHEFIGCYQEEMLVGNVDSPLIAIGQDYTDLANALVSDFNPATLNTTDSSFDDLPCSPVLVRGTDASPPEGVKLNNLGELSRLYHFDMYGRSSFPYDIYCNFGSIDHSIDLLFCPPDDSEQRYQDESYTLGSVPVSNANPEDYDAHHLGSLNSNGSAGQATDLPYNSRLSNYFTINSPLTDQDIYGVDLDNDGDGLVVLPGTAISSLAMSAPVMREVSIPGRININTAPVSVLTALPLLLEPNLQPNQSDYEEYRRNLAGLIVSYRDNMTEIPGAGFAGEDFNSPGDRDSFIPGSFDIRDAAGFASAGELAAVMRGYLDNSYRPVSAPDLSDYWAGDSSRGPACFSDYVTSPDVRFYDDGYEIGGPVVGTADPPRDDITKHDMLWNYLSNVVTVNSDVYCAYIWMQEGPELNAPGRRFMVIFDRTNCVFPGDKPAVKAMVEIPDY